MKKSKKIRFPQNEHDYNRDYHGWANVNNGRYFMSGRILDNQAIWHNFTSDDTGMIMEIDGAKLESNCIGILFVDKFSDIKITCINGHKIVT